MDKQEILNALKISREVNTMDDTPNWRRAFEAYNAAQGTKIHARDRCSKCFQRVLEWLQS